MNRMPHYAQLPLLVLLLICVTFICKVRAQKFDSPINIKQGAVKDYTFSISKHEKLNLQFLKPQAPFELTVSKLEDQQYLPEGFTPLVIFQFKISWNPSGDPDIEFETFTAPIYNLFMSYSYSQTDLAKKGLEQEGIKFYYYNSDEATWMEFDSATSINALDGKALQGASSLSTLKYTTETIAILAPPIKKTSYATEEQIKGGEYSYFTVQDKKNLNKLKVMFHPLSQDGDWTIKIEKMTKLLPGTAMTKGLTRLDSTSRNYYGFKLTTTSHGNALIYPPADNTTEATGPRISKGQVIFDMTENKAIPDVAFAVKSTVVALQYNKEHGTYFGLKTSWNGYVFYMEPIFFPDETETVLYLVQVEVLQPSGVPATIPVVPLTPIYVPANVPYVVGLFNNVNSSRAYPVATLSFDNVERPFVAQVLQVTGENPLTDGILPDMSKNETLVFFEVLIPGDTLEFSFRVSYEHRGNRVKPGVPINRSTLQLLMMKNNKWTILPKTRRSGSSITTNSDIPPLDIMDKSTWFGVVAVTGDFTGISGGNHIAHPGNILLSMLLLVFVTISSTFM